MKYILTIHLRNQILFLVCYLYFQEYFELAYLVRGSKYMLFLSVGLISFVIMLNHFLHLLFALPLGRRLEGLEKEKEQKLWN